MTSIIINHIEIKLQMKSESLKKASNWQIITKDKFRNNTNGPKDWWKTLKTFIKSIKTSSIPLRIVDDHIYWATLTKQVILMIISLSNHNISPYCTSSTRCSMGKLYTVWNKWIRNNTKWGCSCIVTGVSKQVSIENLLWETGWERYPQEKLVGKGIPKKEETHFFPFYKMQSDL